MNGDGATGRVAQGAAPAGPRVVGPPSPVRSSKSCDSGEWVTEPARRGPHPATGPACHTQ
jgi:hypothetical protein